MGTWSIKMKTHSREDVTDSVFYLHKCKEHGVKPKIIKMVVGKRKETMYVANCQTDDCGKIAYRQDEVVKYWNNANGPEKTDGQNYD